MASGPIFLRAQMRLPNLNSFISWLEVSVRSHCTQLGWCEEVSALPGDPTQVTPPPLRPALAQPGGSHRQRAVPWGGGWEREATLPGLCVSRLGRKKGPGHRWTRCPSPPTHTHTHTHTHPEDENHAVQLCSWQRKGSLSARNGAWISDRLEQPVQSRKRELNSFCIIHMADLNQVLGDSWKRGTVSPEPGEETFMVFCHPRGAGERTR